MAEGHVCGQHTTHEWGGGGLGVYSPRKCLKFEAQKCHFPHSEHPNLHQNFMLTILVFEIKEGKKRTKSKKNINHNLSLLNRRG